VSAVAFPEFDSFHQVFDSFEPIEDLHSYKSQVVKTWIDGKNNTTLTSFCSCRSGSLDVVPNQKVIDYIEDSIVFTNDYRLSFDIVKRDDGTSLIMVKYDRILVNRWLAIVKSNTVPTF